MDAHPLGGILRYFESVPDPRRNNASYSLAQLLTLTLMGVLCRCEDYEDIADWVHLRRDWLTDLLGLPPGRTPCAKTFERLFCRLQPRPLLDCFIRLTDALAERQPGRLVAMTARRCGARSTTPTARCRSIWSTPGTKPTACCWVRSPWTRRATKSPRSRPCWSFWTWRERSSASTRCTACRRQRRRSWTVTRTTCWPSKTTSDGSLRTSSSSSKTPSRWTIRAC